MASSLTTDKTIYNPGEIITGTITRDLVSITLPGTAGSDVLSVTIKEKVATTLGPDSTGRVYTLKSDDGTSAVYTATA